MPLLGVWEPIRSRAGPELISSFLPTQRLLGGDRTPSRQANIQALRSTLILAAHDDNQISPLEFLQSYPTQTLYIDGIRLARIAQTAKRISAAGTERVVGSLLDEIEEWLVALQASAAEVVCDCPPAS